MYEGLQIDAIEEVDTIVHPMVQHKIVLISHIDFVIPKEFHGVVNVILFLVLPK